MNMNYLRIVQITLKYIEERLKDDISLAALSRNAGYSRYHFCRVFKAVTGLPAMDYVRKRRLVHALADMEKGRKMAGIALDYGFGTQGAMIKAFRKVYGDTPGHYRIQVLGKLPNDIQLAGISKYGKGEDEMHIGQIDNDLFFKKSMILADKLFNITARNFKNDGPEFWKKQLSVTPELMIYAEDKGKIIGLAYGFTEEDSVTISYVGTEQEYRDKGIEQALVKEMEKRAKALGYSLLAAGAMPEEESLWQECGYTGLLLIQSEKNRVEELRALNPGLKEINARVYDGNVNQLFLEIPAPDRALEKKYEEAFPDCNTIMVYTRRV
jgi:AraC-like DNA-binding protein/GNAT superfamily N-acetyltransferase